MKTERTQIYFSRDFSLPSHYSNVKIPYPVFKARTSTCERTSRTLSIERFRVAFTGNGKREFEPRDPVFRQLLPYCFAQPPKLEVPR